MMWENAYIYAGIKNKTLYKCHQLYETSQNKAGRNVSKVKPASGGENVDNFYTFSFLSVLSEFSTWNSVIF